MGAPLTQAQSWFAKRWNDLSGVDQAFIEQSIARERKTRARARRVQILIYVLLVGIIFGLIGVINEAYVKEQVNWYWTMRPYRVANVDPYVLSADAERAKCGQPSHSAFRWRCWFLEHPWCGLSQGSLPNGRECWPCRR